MYKHSSKIPLVLTLFGMFIKQIALRVQRDKRGANVYGEELFPRQRFPRTGRISCVWTTTRHNYLASCHTRSPFYREREGKAVYATDGHDVLCSMAQIDSTGLVPCSHEEADTRLFLHVADAIKKGDRKLLVRTVDTDVVVVAIATLNRTKPDDLSVAFGTCGHFRFIPIHEVAAAVGPRKSATLPLFHALTGCDTVSSFAGIGQKTAWAAWNVYPEVTEEFEELMHMADPISDRTLDVIERFVVLMYSRTSDLSRVNDARKQLFAQKSRSLENSPPTQAV